MERIIGAGKKKRGRGECRGQYNLSFRDPTLGAAMSQSHSDTHSLSHSPSGVWLSMPLSVWLRMSLTRSLVPPTHHPPTHTHTHTHTESHPCFPSVTLYSADSSVACQKCWSLIATVRWDGPRGIEFRMTAVNCGAGVGSGSCLGTVLPL